VAVVANEAQFSKFVHEETHTGSGRADHLRQRLLADFRDHRLRFSFLAKIRQQQEQPGETFLARIEQLIGFGARLPSGNLTPWMTFGHWF